MINDIKLGFKVMEFGHGRVSTLIGCLIVIFAGVFICGISAVFSTSLPGGYFFMMAEIFAMQLYYSVNISSLVLASPARKKLMTSVPAALSTACMLAAYAVTLLIVGFVSYLRPDNLSAACAQIAFTAGIMGVVLIYTGAVYKYFVAATGLFLVGFLCVYLLYPVSGVWISSIFGSGWNAFALTAALGLVFLLICSCLEYLLFLALYRAPMSKMSQNNSLRRQL